MGLKSRRFLGMSVRHTGAEVSSTDKDTKPVLVMKSLVEKQKREAEAQANPYTPEKADEDWDEIEKLFSHIGKSKTANTAP